MINEYDVIWKPIIWATEYGGFIIHVDISGEYEFWLKGNVSDDWGGGGFKKDMKEAMEAAINAVDNRIEAIKKNA